MTAINKLVKKPYLEEEDLFVIWDSTAGRTRSIYPDEVVQYIVENGDFPPYVESVTYENDIFTITYSDETVQQFRVDRPNTGTDAPEGVITANGSGMYYRTYQTGDVIVKESWFNPTIGSDTGWSQLASFSEAV